MRAGIASHVTQGLRFGQVKETLVTGIPGVDELIQGFPRGAVSEIVGPETSGRTTLLHSLLASATSRQEVCAYVDASDSFDPYTAKQSGVVLPQLVWVRCGHQPEHALKAIDYLLHAGGFGVVALDLGLLSQRQSRRIPMSYWYRFRQAVENTPTILVVIGKEPMVKSCATLQIEMKRKKVVWSGASGFSLLRGVQVEVASRKPLRPSSVDFKARAATQE
jgi:recombination protein RecA